jgi:hypothetical protein
MFDPFEVGPCLGAELDRMHATGVGPAGQLESQSATSIWGAGLGGVFASWTLVPPLALVIHGEMVLAPVQHRFVFQPGPVPVYSPSRVAARGAIGLELRF